MIAALVLVVLVLATPAALAHEPPTAPSARTAAVEQPCPGDEMKPDKVITGSFGPELQGSYVMVPFTVPSGTTAVRVKYCFESGHTLDLGLYDTRVGGELWGAEHFRGWGGSSHPDVWVSAEGFSDEEAYKAKPRGNVPGRTTRGFTPGPVQPGVWAAELGLAAIGDGGAGWRLELSFPTDRAFADEPYRPARYDSRPARAEPGWYAGDLHVHAEHSALGDATMTETFGYAFGEGGLDFVTLSDYVTRSGWGEIGRHQARHPGKLVTRSAEVITYRGHANNQTSARYVDHRTGPVYELEPDGSLAPRRAARPASAIFTEVLAAGGFTQVNHPTIFPSEVPGFSSQCRGCPWDYDDASTDWSKVNAYEVHTGPAGLQDGPLPGQAGPNPFTVSAVEEYERLLAAGHRIAAVAASDSHNAGRRNNAVTQSPIGQGHTVVHAQELSEAGVRCGVQAGHTYAKVWGADRPDIRLEARAAGVDGVAIFGDTLRAGEARFVARVIDGSPDYTLHVMRNGTLLQAAPGTGELSFTGGPGRYSLRLMRGTSYEAISTPIWVEAADKPALVTRDCTSRRSAKRPPKLRLQSRPDLQARRATVRCSISGGSARRCSVRATAGRRVLARGTGAFRGPRATVRLHLTKAGRTALRSGKVRARLFGQAASGASLALAARKVRLTP